jgi:DNA-3-methyladenine glycosylase
MSDLLPQEFYFNDTETVAKKLLGKILCYRNPEGEILKGRITETEAYLGIEDAAAHTFGGRRTERNKSMYLDGGHSYIYFIYGMYYCLKVVTKTHEHPEAVLIRALEPVQKGEVSTKKKDLKTNGPGKLCRYLGLTKEQDGLKMWKKSSGLWILDNEEMKPKQIVSRPRIGVDYAGEAAAWPMRFYIKDNPFVSRL